MSNELYWLLSVVFVAILFDFINGFHDAANAIATVVSTNVLPVRRAIAGASVLNFIGALFGTAVAITIANGFADQAIVTQQVVLGALIGACTWNLITWWFGIPSSSSHALVGGLGGAVVAHAGWGAFNWHTLLMKVIRPLVAAPIMGFAIAFLLMISLLWLVRNMRASKVNHYSRRAQLVSAGMMAFSHGSNDAQKSMGIITLALVSFQASGHASALPAWAFPTDHGHVPMWVILTCAAAISLGTLAGGKKIIKTMGSKIFKIAPIHGFAAEVAGALTILLATPLSLPVSTTHVINGSLMGAGASKRFSAVRWGMASRILIAWVVTLPASALVAAGTTKLLALL